MLNATNTTGAPNHTGVQDQEGSNNEKASPNKGNSSDYVTNLQANKSFRTVTRIASLVIVETSIATRSSPETKVATLNFRRDAASAALPPALAQLC